MKISKISAAQAATIKKNLQFSAAQAAEKKRIAAKKAANKKAAIVAAKNKKTFGNMFPELAALQVA